ncbi:MAG: hypothetical protein V3U06_11030, partial [Candidatus Binatia bacterium]
MGISDFEFYKLLKNPVLRPVKKASTVSSPRPELGTKAAERRERNRRTETYIEVRRSYPALRAGKVLKRVERLFSN